MRWTLVFLLCGPVLAQEFDAARAAMEAQLKAGDELQAKGDLDGAIAAYGKALVIFKGALAKEEGKAAEGKGEPAPEPVPADDGTPEGRKRVVAYYVKLLADPSDDVRYQAIAQLGEMRAFEARDALLAALEKDKYQVARRAAAWALGRLGKEGVPAIPALIREVGGEFPLLAHMCDGALSNIAEAALGERATMGFTTEMTPAQRLEVQGKWQEWFEKNREKLAVAPQPPAEKPAERPPEPPPVEKPAEPPPPAKPAEGGG